MSKIYTSLHIEGQLIYNNNPQEGYVLTTDSFGLVSWTSSTSVLPTASNTDFGYMKLGQSLNINTSGVTEIATASSDRLGGVRVGSGLTVSNTGVLSLSGSGVSGNYLPLTGGTMSGDIHMNGAKIIGTDSNNYIQLASGYQYFYYEYDLRKSSIINNSGVELKGGFSDNSLYFIFDNLLKNWVFIFDIPIAAIKYSPNNGNFSATVGIILSLYKLARACVSS